MVAGSAPFALFHPTGSAGTANNRGGRAFVSGVDLSGMAAGTNIVQVASGGSANSFMLADCKMPASWTGNLLAGAVSGSGITPGIRVALHNCDGVDTNYRIWEEDNYGSVKSETTIVRTGGATDGTTPLSWKLTSTALTQYPIGIFYTGERAQWNELIGSSKTLSLEIVHDSQGSGTAGRFTDEEIWLEAMALSTSGFPLGTWVRDNKANYLATPTNQTDSGATWTTTGLTTPLKQVLSVTVTPQEKGHILYRVAFAARNTKTV